jgi:PKD repeat protein
MKTRCFSAVLTLLALLGLSACKKAGEPDENSVHFTASPLTGKLPLTVYFHNASVDRFEAWHWDFGDGQTSTLEHPSHVYTTPGQYAVALTGFDGADSIVRRVENFISVLDVSPPLAGFTVDVGGRLAIETPFKFTNTSLGDISSWLWTFGDGASSTEENPTHYYLQAGTYLVKLTVTGPTGQTSTAQITLRVDQIITLGTNWLGPFYPTKVNGDCDFAAHGPSIKIIVGVQVPVYPGSQPVDRVYLTVFFDAKETTSNWSQAVYSNNHILFYTPPAGLVVKTWESSGDSYKTWEYIDSDHSYDYQTTGFVDFKVMGDTGGNDICNDTPDDTHLILENMSFKVRIGPPN